MKKIILFLNFTILIFLFCAISIGAEEGLPDLSMVQNIYIYNLENDQVLYSKNEADKVYPASTAKIMTGMLAVDFYRGRYSEQITVTKEALGSYKGKNIQLKAGEVVTVEDLLYATIVGGANDAANVLAYEISGGHDIFIDMMNYKASEIGMKNTHYTNAYGYSDPDMYTTAEDTLYLAKYAYLVQGYMDICSVSRYVLPETNTSKIRYIYNSNYLISTNIETKYRNKEAQGINAGSTVEGGDVVVTSVSRNGMTNFYVLIGGASDEENIYVYKAVNELIDWSYDNFEYKKVVDSSEMICEVDVKLSSQVDYVVLTPEKSVQYFLPVSVDVSKEVTRNIELAENVLEAPIEAGYVAGTLTLSYRGEEIAKINLITKNNVDRNSFLYVLARIQNFTRSPKFKIMILCIAVVVLMYIISFIYRKTRSNRYRYKYNKYRRK